MKFIYQLANRTYNGLISLAAPFHSKAKLLKAGRQQAFPYLEEKLAGNRAPIIWFHCASLGEFEQGRPLIETFKKDYPDYKILLTFFSPSGYEVRKNYAQADYVCYLPADSADHAEKFMELVRPEMAFFIKYEFWYHFLDTLHKRQIPVFSVSAIFRKGQLFFKPYGGFYRNILKKFTHLFVQNQQSVDLLQSIGISNVSLSGDTRFDRVMQICSHPKDIPEAEFFKNRQPLMVVGSSWPPDIEVLAPLINESDEKLKFIIAPHEIGQEKLEQLESKLKVSKLRFSEAKTASEAELKTARLLIIDNIGMLSSLYQYGEYAYIGGAFGSGLHNILEAATFGLPVFFGNKNYEKFSEAVELIEQQGAFAISSSEELREIFDKFYKNEDLRQKAAKTASTYVESRTGATEQVMNFVKELIINQE